MRTKRLLVISLALAVIALVIMSIRGCGNEKKASEAYDLIETALKNVLKQDEKVRKEAKELEKENVRLDSTIADLVADRDLMQGALIDESDKANRLAQAVKDAKAKKDTAQYYEKCDSLAEENSLLRDSYNRMNDNWNKVFAAKEAFTDNLRSQKELYRHAYDSCVSAVKTSDSLLPAIKPKSKLYIDAAATTGYINGIGGGFSLVDTKGNRFGAKYMFTNQQPIYMVEYGRLLSLGKRK